MTGFTTVRSACGSCGGTRPLPTSFSTVTGPEEEPVRRAARGAAGRLRSAAGQDRYRAMEPDIWACPGPRGEAEQPLPLPYHGGRPKRQTAPSACWRLYEGVFPGGRSTNGGPYLHRIVI